MSTLKCLLITVCLLAGSLPHAAAGTADDRAAEQMIGLCYRDGSKGMVLEEILKAEGEGLAERHRLEPRIVDRDIPAFGQGESRFADTDRAVEVQRKEGSDLRQRQPEGLR